MSYIFLPFSTLGFWLKAGHQKEQSLEFLPNIQGIYLTQGMYSILEAHSPNGFPISLRMKYNWPTGHVSIQPMFCLPGTLPWVKLRMSSQTGWEIHLKPKFCFLSWSTVKHIVSDILVSSIESMGMRLWGIDWSTLHI